MNLYLCIGFGWQPQTSNTSFFFPPVKMVLEVEVTGNMVVGQQNLLHRICFSFCWFFLVTQQNDAYVCIIVYLLIIKQVTNKKYRLSMYNADTTPKAPRQCKYIESTLDNKQQNCPKPMRAVYNTPHEAFCIALFLTYS